MNLTLLSLLLPEHRVKTLHVLYSVSKYLWNKIPYSEFKWQLTETSDLGGTEHFIVARSCGKARRAITMLLTFSSLQLVEFCDTFSCPKLRYKTCRLLIDRLWIFSQNIFISSNLIFFGFDGCIGLDCFKDLKVCQRSIQPTIQRQTLMRITLLYVIYSEKMRSTHGIWLWTPHAV